MSADRKHFSLLRMLALLAVLLIETAITVSLWADGWLGTGSNLRLLASATAAALPLGVAAWLIVRNRFRFGLRSLLAAMAFVTLFMFFSVRPLLEAHEARRASRLLSLNGVRVESPQRNANDFYTYIGHDPRPPLPIPSSRGAIAAWLVPLAGDLPSLPPDDTIWQIVVDSDAQALAVCQMASRLENLQGLCVNVDVSPSGMALLQKTMPEFESLALLTVAQTPPVGWLSSLTNVRSLFVYPKHPSRISNLNDQGLIEVAELPNLEVLLIQGLGINDANIQVLSRSKSLRRIILKKTDVTPTGVRALEDAMPNCEILP